LLAGTFRGLDRLNDGWQVRTQVNGAVHASQDPDAEQAYGLALLHLLRLTLTGEPAPLRTGS
jgi:hypothetical protein